MRTKPSYKDLRLTSRGGLRDGSIKGQSEQSAPESSDFFENLLNVGLQTAQTAVSNAVQGQNIGTAAQNAAVSTLQQQTGLQLPGITTPSTQASTPTAHSLPPVSTAPPQPTSVSRPRPNESFVQSVAPPTAQTAQSVVQTVTPAIVPQSAQSAVQGATQAVQAVFAPQTGTQTQPDLPPVQRPNDVHQRTVPTRIISHPFAGAVVGAGLAHIMGGGWVAKSICSLGGFALMYQYNKEELKKASPLKF